MSKRDDFGSGRAETISWGNSDLRVTLEEWNRIFNPPPAKPASKAQFDYAFGCPVPLTGTTGYLECPTCLGSGGLEFHPCETCLTPSHSSSESGPSLSGDIEPSGLPFLRHRGSEDA